MNIQNRDNFVTAGAHAIKKMKIFRSCSRFKSRQGRILQRFKVFSAHPAISQAHTLITFNYNIWIFSSLIFVISAQSEFFLLR